MELTYQRCDQIASSPSRRRRLLAAPGVHRLEVVEVAVGLVEVAVAVEVVAVPDVELREVGVDVRRGLAGGELRAYQASTESSMKAHEPPMSSTALSPYVEALPGTCTQSLTVLVAVYLPEDCFE